MTVQANESGHKKKKSLLSGILGGAKTIWVVAIVLALFAVFGALTILGNAAATQTYWVLGRDVPARTQVTPEMLVMKEAKVGGAPDTAYDDVFVRDNPVFTKIALGAGDIVTASNAGPLTRITEDVPENFVGASFTAEPEIAVAGKVRTGDFIDLIAVNDAATAGITSKVVLQHVLVLDVTVAPSSIAAEAVEGQEGENLDPGPESEAVRGGIPSVYTVAVSPKDATKLAVARAYDLYVVLSGNLPDTTVEVSTSANEMFNSPVGDSSAGSYGSVFIKRWDVAFEAGNVYVDNGGELWKVNAEGQWQQGDAEPLAVGDTPPGYLPIPAGTEFTDKDGLYWVAIAQGDADEVPDSPNAAPAGAAVWVAPETGVQLDAGDNPDGYDPHAEFSQTAAEDVAAAGQ
jgi:Flp pilus assembly protein CpaB